MTKLFRKRIIISKINRIGDVLMALPVAGALKKYEPNCDIVFLCQSYTRQLVERYRYVDQVVCWDELTDPVTSLAALKADIILHIKPQREIARAAKSAKIRLRIGTYERVYHWLTCNKLVNVVRRRSSPLHDAQLDMLYYCALTKQPLPTTQQIIKLYQFDNFDEPCTQAHLLDTKRFNIIIHSRSRTDAGKREWPLENFARLIESLPHQDFNVFVTGTEQDGNVVRDVLCKPFNHVHDLTGKQSLKQLMHFISKVDGLVAGSTGPLHLAAAFGIHTLGLYTPVKGHHPQRWGPLGENAHYLISPRLDCNACGKDGVCACIRDISPQQVRQKIELWRQ